VDVGSSGTVTNLPPLVVNSGMAQRAHLLSCDNGAGIRRFSSERLLWITFCGAGPDVRVASGCFGICDGKTPIEWPRSLRAPEEDVFGGVVTSEDCVVASDQSDSNSGVCDVRSLSPDTDEAEVCERMSNDRRGTRKGRRSGVGSWTCDRVLGSGVVYVRTGAGAFVGVAVWSGPCGPVFCGVFRSEVIERRVLSSGVMKVREGAGIFEGLVSGVAVAAFNGAA
jgi:hypothetical protein